MGARVGLQHYHLGSADSYIGSSLHDLNSVDGPPRDIDGIGGSGGGDSLDNDRDSSSVVCEKFPNLVSVFFRVYASLKLRIGFLRTESKLYLPSGLYARIIQKRYANPQWRS